MTDFLLALGCLLLACLIGQIFLSWGIDNRGSSMPISPLIIYIFVVVYASPFWLFTFVPPYLLADSKSLVWRWYIAPILGILVGSIGSLIVFGAQDTDFPNIRMTPAVIGFALFLIGLIFKKLSGEKSSA